MKKIIKISLMDMKHSKFFMILMMIVCLVSFLTILSSVTAISSSLYQRKEFEEYIGYDIERVLHLRFNKTSEDEIFIDKYNCFLSYVDNDENIKKWGRYDQTGVYFRELEGIDECSLINKKILKKSASKYLKHTAISRVMYMDEEAQSLISDLNLSFENREELPIYVSEIFKDIIKPNQIMTNKMTDEQFIVKGYIPSDLKFYDENDPIRFPLISLAGYFIAPFPESYNKEIMPLLSTLHNTYLFVENSVDVKTTVSSIQEYASIAGIDLDIFSLQEEFEDYCAEKDYFIKAQFLLALFIFVMVTSCVIAVFTTNTILKKKEYGILLANGYDKSDLIAINFCQMSMLIISSSFIAWVIKLLEFNTSDALSTVFFKSVLYKAHLCFSLPLCFAICLLLISVSLLLPMKNILSYEPNELIKGENSNGIN